MTFLSTEEYLARPMPEESWIIENLIPHGGTVLLYGKPKTGKSLLALGLASAIADGEDYFLMKEFKINTRGRIMFLQLDTAPAIWLKYIKESLRPYKNFSWSDVIQIPNPPFNINHPAHQEYLHNQMQEQQPLILIIDSLREIHPGDENDSSVMTKVMQRLKAAVGPNVTIILIAHARKTGQMESPDLIEGSRGSSAITGSVDVLMRLNGTTPERKILDYAGRTRVVASGIKLWQDEDTGMIYRGSQLERQIKEIHITHPGALNTAQLTKVCHENGIKASVSTLRRIIGEMGLYA